MRVYFFNFDHLRITLQSLDLIWGIKFCAPSPSTHLLLPSNSYPWLPMVVRLFLTHLLLEVTSPIFFLPSPFRFHWSLRSKGLHWWRRSKAYKLHMELHHIGSHRQNSWVAWRSCGRRMVGRLSSSDAMPPTSSLPERTL